MRRRARSAPACGLPGWRGRCGCAMHRRWRRQLRSGPISRCPHRRLYRPFPFAMCMLMLFPFASLSTADGNRTTIVLRCITSRSGRGKISHVLYSLPHPKTTREGSTHGEAEDDPRAHAMYTWRVRPETLSPGMHAFHDRRECSVHIIACHLGVDVSTAHRLACAYSIMSRSTRAWCTPSALWRGCMALPRDNCCIAVQLGVQHCVPCKHAMRPPQQGRLPGAHTHVAACLHCIFAWHPHLRDCVMWYGDMHGMAWTTA
eukprot:366094-Chlamydomonas_euryale.AAC.9